MYNKSLYENPQAHLLMQYWAPILRISDMTRSVWVFLPLVQADEEQCPGPCPTVVVMTVSVVSPILTSSGQRLGRCNLGITKSLLHKVSLDLYFITHLFALVYSSLELP